MVLNPNLPDRRPSRALMVLAEYDRFDLKVGWWEVRAPKILGEGGRVAFHGAQTLPRHANADSHLHDVEGGQVSDEPASEHRRRGLECDSECRNRQIALKRHATLNQSDLIPNEVLYVLGRHGPNVESSCKGLDLFVPLKHSTNELPGQDEAH